jgi:fermentation-respiration switch protein FrsA (DUF1100 family)
LGVASGVVCALLLKLALVTRAAAHSLVTSPPSTRQIPVLDEESRKAPTYEVSVTTTDGVKLVGWYMPSTNGAVVIAQHGYKGNRSQLVGTGMMLHRRGYGVLLTSTRGHDLSQGEQITFGYREMLDLDAWYKYLLTRPDVNPERIGAIGNSMGASLVILYAARNPHIKAVVANCGFSSLGDAVSTSVGRLTGLPSFPFARMIVLWAELETGARPSHLDVKAAIKKLSPRPVFLMQGGRDDIVPPQSGEWLYAAAGEPKELWYEPKLDHCTFELVRQKEYIRRVAGFFDKYLLAGQEAVKR